MRRTIPLSRLAFLFALAGAAPSPAGDGPERYLEFDEVTIQLQYCGTDDRAEVLFHCSSDERLQQLRVIGPAGVVFRARRSNDRRLGAADLGFETVPDDLDRVRDAYPEGEYRVVGRTVDGHRIEGDAVLDYDLPPVPEIVRPRDSLVVDKSLVVFEWQPLFGAEEIEVSVEKKITEEEQGDQEDDQGGPDDEDDDRDSEVIRVKIPKHSTSFRIPELVLEPDHAYTVDVVAISRTGNRSFAEREFRTSH